MTPAEQAIAAINDAGGKMQAVTDAMTQALKAMGRAKDALTATLPATGTAPTPPVVTAPATPPVTAPVTPPPVVIPPVVTAPSVPALAAFNNGKPANGAAWFGATGGDGKTNGNGWPGSGDMQSMTDLGLKAIRIPILPQYSLNADGTVNGWVVSHLTDAIKFNISKGVATVLDAHTYLPFTDPTVASFWTLFGPAMEKSLGGPSPLFGIELSNEPGSSDKTLANWTKPLATTIATIRAAGYQGYIFAGAGDWNNATFLPAALATISKPTDMDPLNRTIYTMHDYWNKDADPGKTRNDQGAAVDGTIDIAKRYDPALNAARKLGVKIVMSEIGGGISPQGPLPAFNGVGKDGKQLEDEYIAYAKANTDVLLGSWFWMGGRIGSYRHKIEAGNQHTTLLQTWW